MNSGVSCFAVVGLLGIVAACGGGASSSPPHSTAPTQPLGPVSVATCPAGQMPGISSNSCAPVGPDATPLGFASSGDSWGFHAIVPTSACGDATRAAIGEANCQPVDDCTAPFPPSNAKIVVRSGATPGPGVAATLADAISQVSPGDTIAIDSGTYGGVVVDRDVNFVGRCASSVVIATQVSGDHGIGADGPYKVSAQSISFQGFNFALWVGGGATMTVSHSIFSLGQVAAWVVTGGTLTFEENLVDSTPDILVDGVIVANGGHAAVLDTEFRNIHIAIDAFGTGTRASGSRIVATERSNEDSGLVLAADGAELDVDHSQLVANVRFIGGAQDTDVRNPGSIEPGTLKITTSELVRTETADPSGFDVDGPGSTFELSESTLSYRARIAVSAEDGSTVTVANTVLRPVLSSDVATQSIGAGFVINSTAQLALDKVAILNPAESAILADDCQMTVANSLIEGTWEFARTDLTSRLGIGQAISLAGTATLVMTDSTLLNNAGISIWMSNETASLEMLRSAIFNTEGPSASTSTAGILAWGGTIDVEDSLIQGIPDTAIAVGQATGGVSQTVLSENLVGFRMMGTSKLSVVTGETLRAKPGEVLSERNEYIDTTSDELDATLPLGNCNCSDSDLSGMALDAGLP